MDLLDILNHHLDGGEFEYKSFDFKKASLEYEKTEEWENMCRINDSFCHIGLKLKDKYQIPVEIREKYSYWRKGKLRSVHFNPNGSIYKVLIGAKYAVTFYNNNLSGVKFKH